MNPIDSWIDPAELRKLAESLLQPVSSGPPAGDEAGYGETFVGFADPQRHEGEPGALAPPPPPEEPIGPDPRELQARETLAAARQRADQGGLLTRLPTADRVERAAIAEPQPQPQPQPPQPPQQQPQPPQQPPQPPQQQPQPPQQGSTATPESAAPPDPGPPAGQTAPSPPPLAETAPAQPVKGTPLIERLHAYRDWLHQSVKAEAFFVADRDGHLLFDEIRSEKLQQVARTLANASHAANRQAGGSAVGSLHVKLANNRLMEVLPVDTRYGPLVLALVVPGVLSGSAVELVARGLQQVVNGQNN